MTRQDSTGASDRARVSANKACLPTALSHCPRHALAPHLPLYLPVHHPPAPRNVFPPSPSSPGQQGQQRWPLTTWLLLPLPHPGAPWTAAKTPFAGLSWREEGPSQAGREAPPPLPPAARPAQGNNVTLGPLPGVRVGAGPWTQAWPSCFQEAGGPWPCSALISW